MAFLLINLIVDWWIELPLVDMALFSDQQKSYPPYCSYLRLWLTK